MAGFYIYAWDPVNEVWVKVAVTAAGKLIVTTS